MRIAGIYSFNNGAEIIEATFATELQEIKDCIVAVDCQFTAYTTPLNNSNSTPLIYGNTTPPHNGQRTLELGNVTRL